jgi:hypothetical protein
MEENRRKTYRNSAEEPEGEETIWGTLTYMGKYY